MKTWEMGGRAGVGRLGGRLPPPDPRPSTHQSLTSMSGRVVSISSSQYPSALRSTTWDLRQVLGEGRRGWSSALDPDVKMRGSAPHPHPEALDLTNRKSRSIS